MKLNLFIKDYILIDFIDTEIIKILQSKKTLLNTNNGILKRYTSQ